MRTVTLQLNYRATNDMNWSVKTEVLVDTETDPEGAGHDAANFIWRFQQGMIEGLAEATPPDD